MKCEEIVQAVSNYSIIKDCSIIKDNSIRIATPFQYPDQSNIDLFFPASENMFYHYLTDLGFTFSFLTDMQIKPWGTKKRKQIVSDICDSLGVKLNGGDLQIEIPKDGIKDISSYIVRLAQACIRVADLIFTSRLKSLNSFNESVEEYIESIGLEYKTETLIHTRFNSDVIVDYSVYGKKVESYVLTFSSANQASSHPLANEIFRKWYDLSYLRSSKQFLTLYDSSSDAYRNEDLLRLQEVSNIVGFPAEETEFAELLSA